MSFFNAQDGPLFLTAALLLILRILPPPLRPKSTPPASKNPLSCGVHPRPPPPSFPSGGPPRVYLSKPLFYLNTERQDWPRAGVKKSNPAHPCSAPLQGGLPKKSSAPRKK